MSQPPMFPPPPPGFPPPPPRQRPWVARHKVLTGLLVLVLFGVIGSIANAGKKAETTGTQESVATIVDATTTTASAASEAARVEPTTTRAPTGNAELVLLDDHGKGSKQTKSFKVGKDAAVAYTYDCSGAFADAGYFILEAQPPGEDYSTIMLANTSDKSGSDTSYIHDAGFYYLTVTSVCSWTIKVTG